MEENIKEYGNMMLQDEKGHKIQMISIIGEIEGHESSSNTTKTTKYEHMLPMLASLDCTKQVDGVLLVINTIGGDVSCGLALSEMIASLSKPSVALVMGDSHSIDVPLSVAADYTVIAPSATVIIHPVRMSGTVIAAPQTYNYFQRLQERIVAFVAGHSGIRAEEFQALMLRKDDMAADVGSVVYGEEAVRLKLIDHIGGLSDGLQCLYRQIEQRKKKPVEA